MRSLPSRRPLRAYHVLSLSMSPLSVYITHITIASSCSVSTLLLGPCNLPRLPSLFRSAYVSRLHADDTLYLLTSHHVVFGIPHPLAFTTLASLYFPNCIGLAVRSNHILPARMFFEL
ncbi:hypothetical protein BD310DRAFT_913612, partial [Dichomitus squalens]